MVSIIILTHNQWSYTKLCLDSIRLHTPEAHEIIVVDNGSSDGTQGRLSGYDIAKVIANSTNLGFAVGCNQGINAASGSHILLLNNDVIVTSGWLGRMLGHLDGDAALGAVGPVTNKTAGPQKIEVSYTDPAGIEPFAAQVYAANRGRVMPVPRLIGFCYLMKREVIQRIGGLDTRYGNGNLEDDDLSLRIGAAGLGLAIALDVYVHHFGSATFKGSGMDGKASLIANWSLFRQKWGIAEDASRSYDAQAILAQPRELESLFIDPVASVAEAIESAGAVSADATDSSGWMEVGRNDPCPCGSGKKFKRCHGQG